MAQKKHMNECLLCGDKFPYCGHCTDEREDWREVACSWAHFSYFKPIIEYTRGILTKNEAKARLMEAQDIFGKVKMKPSIMKVFNEITYVAPIAEKKKSKKFEKNEGTE